REARRAIEIAQDSFDNINLDLMVALPEQTLAEARADVEAALEAGTAHLSFYHLTLEPNTLFYRHPPVLPDDDAAAAMQDAIGAALAARGYAHYETSAWAKPGRECRHNLNYWRFGDYLGIGAGAHGKVSFHDRVTRTARWKQPREYLQRVAEGRPVQETHEIGRDDLVFEFMMNALRLTDGFPVASFVERTGLQIAVAERQLREAETRGLIARDHERIRPTDLGQRFLNDLLQLFLPGVFLPIGAGMHAGAALHPRGEQRNEPRLDEAPLVMALLRPGVGKEYVHAVQSVRGDHVLHHLDRVVLDDAQVREMQIGDAFQETADAGRMDFDSEIVVLGMFLRDRRGGLAHPETDFEDPGCRAAEQAGEVQSGG